MSKNTFNTFVNSQSINLIKKTCRFFKKGKSFGSILEPYYGQYESISGAFMFHLTPWIAFKTFGETLSTNNQGLSFKNIQCIIY